MGHKQVPTYPFDPFDVVLSCQAWGLGFEVRHPQKLQSRKLSDPFGNFLDLAMLLRDTAHLGLVRAGLGFAFLVSV